VKPHLGLEPYFSEHHLDDYTVGMIQDAKTSKTYRSHCGEYLVYRQDNPIPMIYVARILAMVQPDEDTWSTEYRTRVKDTERRKSSHFLWQKHVEAQ